MNVIIGLLLFFTGGFIGIAIMSLVQINRLNKNTSAESRK
ncbi:hypothetical protein IGI44_002031 [Enterococcus sp. DIV0756]